VEEIYYDQMVLTLRLRMCRGSDEKTVGLVYKAKIESALSCNGANAAGYS